MKDLALMILEEVEEDNLALWELASIYQRELGIPELKIGNTAAVLKSSILFLIKNGRVELKQFSGMGYLVIARVAKNEIEIEEILDDHNNWLWNPENNFAWKLALTERVFGNLSR